MQKVGLVLEGGSMRGMFTAGVLDVLMDNDIKVDGTIGVSAGALFGVNYFSKQRGRVIRYSKRFCKNPRYMGLTSLLLTGNVVNKNFAFYKVSKKLDVFDDKKFTKNNTGYYAVVTNVETRKPDYLKINKCIDDMEILRASSAMPLVSKFININGKKYLDVAICDSIPINKFKELGYDKIIVVLTQPLDYRKPQFSNRMKKIIKKKYKNYPNLIDAMLNRYKIYNNMVEQIIDMEKKMKFLLFVHPKN